MYLRRKNVYHEIAKDGQQAIDKWKTGNFHLVLVRLHLLPGRWPVTDKGRQMDIQLPIKDGIQATKEIRQAERAANITGFAATPPAETNSIRAQVPILTSGTEPTSPVSSPRNSSVIIVALTASSLDKDRDIALAAGCNDFLTKPVNLDWLNQKLLEWGSMAWLSGFSRPRFSSPTSAGGEIGEVNGRSAFMSASSEKRSREVAEHLYLRPRPGSGGSSKTVRTVGAGAAGGGGEAGEAGPGRQRSRMASITDTDSDQPGPSPAVTVATADSAGSEASGSEAKDVKPPESGTSSATTSSDQSEGTQSSRTATPSP